MATRHTTPTGGAHGQATSTSRSGSLVDPTYWWYTARAELLEAALGHAVVQDSVVVDIGSADGPSVAWMDARARRVPVDIDPTGLPDGGVCAAATALPFADASLDVVSAFDVVEHVAREAALLRELRRVLRPGGRLLVSVPAYQWAWSSHDVAAGHHRRYTRPRLVAALEAAGFVTERVTYAFAATFPFFAADRLKERLVGAPAHRVVHRPPPVIERLLLRCAALDASRLRRGDLPFGSSLFAAAVADPRVGDVTTQAGSGVRAR